MPLPMRRKRCIKALSAVLLTAFAAGSASAIESRLTEALSAPKPLTVSAAAQDAAALVGLALFGAAAAAVAWAATTQYSFYPQLSVPAPWPGYIVYAAWMVLPCVLHAIDEKRFG